MSAIGIALQQAYRLRRYVWLEWSLARWLGSLLALAGLAALIRFWPRLWPSVAVGGLLLIYILFLAWAHRRGYVRFEAALDPQSLFRDALSGPPLRKEELVPLRASGWFTVEGKDQYYVDLEADYETVGTREHIILARVHASRFLRFGRWPAQDIGWWYAFFRPAMIQHLSAGHLHFGPRTRPALQVVYAQEEDKPQTIFLAFIDAATMLRVWEDLLRDAPPGVVSGPITRPRQS